MSMTNKEIDSIISRIKDAKKRCEELVKDENADARLRKLAGNGTSIFEELVSDMCAYTDSVFEDKFKNSNLTEMRENANSREEYQEKYENLELNRKMAHNSLIISVKTSDLVCRKIGVPEIYGKLPKEFQNDVSVILDESNRYMPGVLETRHGIAEWAWDFVIGCIIDMNVEIDPNSSRVTDYKNDKEKFEDVQKKFNSEKAKKMIQDLTEPER